LHEPFSHFIAQHEAVLCDNGNPIVSVFLGIHLLAIVRMFHYQQAGGQDTWKYFLAIFSFGSCLVCQSLYRIGCSTQCVLLKGIGISKYAASIEMGSPPAYVGSLQYENCISPGPKGLHSQCTAGGQDRGLHVTVSDLSSPEHRCPESSPARQRKLHARESMAPCCFTTTHQYTIFPRCGPVQKSLHDLRICPLALFQGSQLWISVLCVPFGTA